MFIFYRSPRRSPLPRKSHSPVRRSRSPLNIFSARDAATAGSSVGVKQRCRDYDGEVLENLVFYLSFFNVKNIGLRRELKNIPKR